MLCYGEGGEVRKIDVHFMLGILVVEVDIIGQFGIPSRSGKEHTHDIHIVGHLDEVGHHLIGGSNDIVDHMEITIGEFNVELYHTRGTGKEVVGFLCLLIYLFLTSDGTVVKVTLGECSIRLRELRTLISRLVAVVDDAGIGDKLSLLIIELVDRGQAQLLEIRVDGIVVGCKHGIVSTCREHSGE